MNTLLEKSITPEAALALLQKEGINLSLDEAKHIVDFLYLLSEIYLNEGKEI
jgi:hypothetical protein